MIKKCAPLILKASSSPLSFAKNTTAIIAVFSNQTKRNINKQRITTIEGEQKMKPLNINPVFQGASQQCENKREILSEEYEQHVFSGEQKSYFLAVTSVILLFNFMIRLFIQPHAPLNTYERKN